MIGAAVFFVSAKKQEQVENRGEKIYIVKDYLLLTTTNELMCQLKRRGSQTSEDRKDSGFKE
jgi:hypothetical protein